MSMFLCAIYAYVIKHLVLAPSETFFWVLEFVVILIENHWHTYLHNLPFQSYFPLLLYLSPVSAKLD